MYPKKVQEFISIAFVMLFVYAATSKLLDYTNFATQIGQSPMLTNFTNLLAWLVPVTELIVSVLLVFEGSRLLGFYLAVGLMTIFTAYIVLASQFSNFVPCSCGGVIQNLSWTQHFFFNLVFIVAGSFAVIIDKPIVDDPLRNNTA